MMMIETAAFAARAAGRLANKPALGTTIHHTLFTASRFLLIIFLPILGFLVESNISYEKYFLTVLLCLIGSFLGSCIIIKYLNNVQIFFQKVFYLYKDSTIPVALLGAILKKNDDNLKYVNLNLKLTSDRLTPQKVFVSFLAYSFLGTGFFIAFLLALIYTEHRLTLSQFTAVFHGFGAIIVSFYLDPMLSRSIDQIKSNNMWLNNLYSILIGRIISYFVTSIIFVSVYYLFFK
tara:strand:- start:5355 stop:6056 length:702 start_codon:yes stop_codon:yes gene_type:complete